jgi:hypothetical protein
MLIPPKITLCTDQRVNTTAQNILQNCILALDNFTIEKGCIVSVILTGSFSRGEGSVLFVSPEKTLILGDMEFIIITTVGTNLKQIASSLQSVAKKVESSLEEQSIICSIEFSPVARNFLKKAKPAIFNYELLLNGKVVYGDKDILNEFALIAASQIPKHDAFYLLCNRVVEQLSYFAKISSSDLNDLQIIYPLVKLYMDMAGSFLIMTGHYEPSYSQRYETFTKMNAPDCFVTGDLFPVFLKRLEDMTKFKLQPKQDNSIMSDISPEAALCLFRDSMKFVRQLWQWEIRHLTNNVSSVSLGDSYKIIMKSYSLKARIRGWLKFLRIAWNIGESLSFLKIFKLFFVGPPQMLIYCAAVQLYFSLESNGTCDINKVISFLPTRSDAANQQEAITAVVNAWNQFIRSV